VRFARTSNLPEDVVVNTFHFFVSGAVVSPADAATITQRVIDFYKVAPLPGDIVAGYLSALLSRAANIHEVRVYDLGALVPRPVILSTLFSIPNANADPGIFPAEVSIVLSVKTTTSAGVPVGRTRGRIYLGTINGVTAGAPVLGDITVSSPVRTLIVNAAVRLMSPPADPLAWGVYSPTDGLVRRVISASVDDRFDTQRRRGGAPTVRLVGNVSGGI
jgi:hypothetical protein